MASQRRCPHCDAEFDAGWKGPCPACFKDIERTDFDPGSLLTGVPVAPAAHAGQRIGPYRLGRVLGEGGMGIVYLADQDEPIQRRVALKLIKLGMDTRRVVSRFLAERQTLALMDHPNIAAVYDAGSTPEGRPYFVMEYVKGVAITDYCDQHRLSNRERIELFVQVCSAVQHAHQKGIIHRDLKPSNVLVTVQDGRPVPKIIDFGIARATSQHQAERTAFTEHGWMIGTPEYLSPEQAEMTSLDVDATSDIYSLGVMLYELIVGSLPFEPKRLREAGFGEIQRILRDEDPPRPSARLTTMGATATDVARKRSTQLPTLSRDLKGDLDWITLKAMAKDRTRRYSSASEFAADLTRHLNNEPTVARPTSVTYKVGKFVRRHTTGVAVAAGVLIALVAGLAVTTMLYGRAESARREAQYLAYVASLRAASADLEAGDASQAEQRLLAVAPEFRTNWEWRYLYRQTDSSEAILSAVEDTSAPPVGLAVASDARHVLLATKHLVQTWDLETKARSIVYSTDRQILAMNASGTVLASVLDLRDDPDAEDLRSPLNVVEVASGRVLRTIPVTGVGTAAFSSSGERLAIESREGLSVWHVPSGERLTTDSSPSFRSMVLAGDGTHVLYLNVLRPIGATRQVSLDLSPVIRAAVFTPDGTRLVTCELGGRLALWSVDSGTRQILGENEEFLVSLAVSPDSRYLAAGYISGDVHVWDLDSQVRTGTLRSDRTMVERLAFSPDGRHLLAATGAPWPEIRIWDFRRIRAGWGFPREWRGLLGAMASRPPARAALPPDLVPAAPEPRRPDAAPRPGTIRARAIAGDGSHAAFALDDRVQIWTLSSLALRTSIDVPGVRRLVLNEDGSRVLLVASTGRAMAGPVDGQPLMPIGDGAVGVFAMSADGLVGAIAQNERIKIWDLVSGRELATVDSEHPARAVALDVTGRRLYTWTRDARASTDMLRGWTIGQQQPGWTLSRPLLDSFSLAADGSLLAIGGSKPTRFIQVLTATTGAIESEFRPSDDDAVRPIALWSNGRRLIQGGDGDMRVWDLDTRTELLGVRWPGGYLRAIVGSPDGHRLVAESFDGVRVFDGQLRYAPRIRQLVSELYDEHLFSNAVLEHVRRQPDLSREEQSAALAYAVARGESAVALMDRSLTLAEPPDQLPERYQTARQMAEQAVKLAPRCQPCQMALGIARYRNGDYEGALRSLLGSIRVGPSLSTRRDLWLAMTHARLGQTSEAKLILERVQRVRENYARLRRSPAGFQDPELAKLDSLTKEVEAAISSVGGSK